MNNSHIESRNKESCLKSNHNLPNVGLPKLTRENKEAVVPPKPSGRPLAPVSLQMPPLGLPTNYILDTNSIRSNFLNEMLSYELSKSPENLRTDFLKRHKITPEIRARMVP